MLSWIWTITTAVLGFFTGKQRRERLDNIEKELRTIRNMFAGLSKQNEFHSNQQKDRLEIVLGVLRQLDDRGVDWLSLLRKDIKVAGPFPVKKAKRRKSEK